MTPDRLTSEHLAAIETACENALADQRSPGIGVHTILSLVAAVRERDNTIAEVRELLREAEISSADENPYVYADELRDALDPQETE